MYGETRGALMVCRVRVIVEWACDPRGRDVRQSLTQKAYDS
jgi:hypothetical protein